MLASHQQLELTSIKEAWCLLAEEGGFINPRLLWWQSTGDVQAKFGTLPEPGQVGALSKGRLDFDLEVVPVVGPEM